MKPGQQSPKTSYVSAQDGSSAKWLLVLLATTITSAASQADDAVSECRRFYALHPQPLPDLVFWTGDNGEDFVQIKSTSSGGWLLQGILSLHTLEVVDQNSTWTSLCVGLVDTTSYTRNESFPDKAQAWVTFHTLRQVPAGLVHLQTLCWLRSKHFTQCSPSFAPLPYIQNLPLYHYSPLEEDFWTNMTSESLQIKENWIWRINTQTQKGSIPAHWIYNMNISSLKSLEILGNNWKKPDKLLKALENLERLDLSHNNLEAIPKEMLHHMPALQVLILGHNNISEYPQGVGQLKNLQLLDLTNPIGNATLKIDNKDVENLPKSLQILGLENTKLQANITNILLLPNLIFLNLSGCALGFINDQQFVNTPRKLITIDLSHNNLQYLPENIFTEMSNLKTLILTNNSLQVWPENILIKNELTKLSLSHNHLQNISSGSFKNFKELEILDLSNNKLISIPDMLFNYTPYLTEINLSHNQLKQGPNLWNLQIKNLDLSHNNLSDFRNNMSSIGSVDLSYNGMCNIDISSKVEKMNISYNSISYISPVLWTKLMQLKELDLGANGFECCLFENRTYLNEPRITHVTNLNSFDPLTCSINKTSPKILLETFVYNETECNPFEATEVLTPYGIAVILPLTILIFTGTIIAVMMYVYRFELIYISHLFRMKKVGAETDEQRYKTCVYDAFVCYSARNFEWVTGTLLPALEGGPEGYRLCVHDRDFALGAAINRNIVASLEKSRKVIFVLSHDFIVSKWCQWELEMANHKMFEEKRNCIVLVELERLARRALPRHLRYLMARTTYLEWPEAEGQGAGAGAGAHAQKQRACLRRLRDALGDSLRQRTGRDNAGCFTVLDAP